MKKFFSLLTFVFGILFFLTSCSFALASEFAFDYEVYYSVNNSGITNVTTNVILTNKTTDYYAENFNIIFNSAKINQVSGFDETGAIAPLVTQNSGQTNITLPFNNKVVGINQKKKFTFVYQSQDIATKKGRIWEIIIPGIDKNEKINTYSVNLTVPESFGQPKYISPKPIINNTWSLSDINKQGIIAIYGDYQIFAFKLIYHLSNISNKTEIQEITLPPDTAFQQIIIKDIDQKPLNVILDNDANWLAQYKLQKNQQKKITVTGNALIYLNPRKDFRINQDFKKIDYINEQKFWEKTPEMQKKADDLKTAENIYNFVKNHLSYDYERAQPEITRLGAVSAFENPKTANCMEFADLFVTLSRSAKIPAKVINGYAYTTNSRLQPYSLTTDILHAWSEYYDENHNLWIPVDPTWGNTTNGVDYFHQLDFNHIAFAILGQNSNYPFPAGSFKNSIDSKSVFIDFVNEDDFQIPESKFEIKLNKNNQITFDNKLHYQINILNTGNTLIDFKSVKLNSNYKISSATENSFFLPPYGNKTINLELEKTMKIFSQKPDLHINLNGKTQDFILDINFMDIVFSIYSLGFLIILALVFVIIKGYVAKSRIKKTN